MLRPAIHFEKHFDGWVVGGFLGGDGGGGGGGTEI